MRSYFTTGTTREAVEAQAVKELKVGQRCLIDGEHHEHIRRISGNGWAAGPFMRILEED